MNAIAGGGAFFTSPPLVFAGVPAPNANVSSTIVGSGPCWRASAADPMIKAESIHLLKKFFVLQTDFVDQLGVDDDALL